MLPVPGILRFCNYLQNAVATTYIFVLQLSTFLFYNKHTLVESARANDLDVYEYLNHILTVMPNTDFCNQPEAVDSLLPWSDQLPEICYLSKYRKKRSPR